MRDNSFNEEEKISKEEIELERITKKFGEEVEMISEKLSIPFDQRKSVARRAARSYKRAKNDFELLHKFLDANNHNNNNAHEGNGDESSEEEDEPMEEFSVEDGEEENENDANRRVSVRRMMLYWTRLLDQVSQMVQNGFYNMFDDVADFLERFSLEKKKLEGELDQKWQEVEINKVLRKGERHLSRLSNANLKRNGRVASNCKEKLEEQLEVLREIQKGREISSLPLNPHSQTFISLNEFERKSQEVLNNFEKVFGDKEKAKRMERESNRRQARKFADSIVKMRMDIQKQSTELDATLKKAVEQATKESNEMAQSMKKRE